MELKAAAEYGDPSAECLARSGLGMLLARWNALSSPIPCEEIRAGLAGLTLARETIGEWVRFDERGYQRNRVHLTESYEILVLCWLSGQHSPIHDHGESACGVLVVDGVATETIVVADQGHRLLEERSRRLQPGSIMISRGVDIHRVANREAPGVELVTLHVYSPPLKGVRNYRVDGAEQPLDSHCGVALLEPNLAPIALRTANRRITVDPFAGGQDGPHSEN
jgi:cysteine dioxygenase